jgi:hypothetical protein
MFLICASNTTKHFTDPVVAGEFPESALRWLWFGKRTKSETAESHHLPDLILCF